MDKDFNSPPDLELPDIRNVRINPALPKEERLREFIKQIKDPYCFRCGKFTVRAQFSKNGATLEDCLKQILL